MLHHLRAFLYLQSVFTPGGRIRLVSFSHYSNELPNSPLRKSYTAQHNSVGLSFTSTSAHGVNSWADLSKCYDHEIAATRNAARAASELNFLARDALLAELEEERQLALKRGQASAAVQASMGKAKILGLIIDRREVGDVGRFDSFTNEQLVNEAARLARSLGIAGPRLVEDDNEKSL